MKPRTPRLWIGRWLIAVAIAWWLLAGAAPGVALMPASGFYLLLPPALVLLPGHDSLQAPTTVPWSRR